MILSVVTAITILTVSVVAIVFVAHCFYGGERDQPHYFMCFCIGIVISGGIIVGITIGGAIGCIIACLIACIGMLPGIYVFVFMGASNWRKIYCPFCFESIKVSEIKFYCHHCSTEISREPSFWEKIGIASPKSAKCSYGHTSTFKRCPNQDCNRDLPHTIGDLSDISIAIIGARGSGKTHYIALLIQRIAQIGSRDKFDWTLNDLVSETRKRYDSEFRKPLFVDHITIEPTGKGKSDPLLYCLRQNIRLPGFIRCLNTCLNTCLLGSLQVKDQRRIMLVFFDTAGENLDVETYEMDAINRYICNASGIICLLDPLQLPSVRRELQGKIELPAQNTDTAQVLGNVHRLLEHGFIVQNRQMTRNDQVPIPLAVTFSKIDAIKAPDGCPATLLHETCVIYQESRHYGYLNLGEFHNINNDMETWLTNVDPSVLQPCGHFADVAFFGVSALGEHPTTDTTTKKQVLSRDPRPRRVEDPLLWILHKKGWIDARED